MNNCLYYLESSSSGKDKLHIATNKNKYPDVKSLQKKDALIATIKPQDFKINFVKVVNVLWPLWQKVPALVLAEHLRRKYRA